MNLINTEAVKKVNKTISVRILSGRAFLGNWVFLVNIFSLLISWHFNHSILWAIFHYIFGIYYLIYTLLNYRFADGGFMEIVHTYI
jgi:hypothetical protein